MESNFRQASTWKILVVMRLFKTYAGKEIDLLAWDASLFSQ